MNLIHYTLRNNSVISRSPNAIIL